MELCSISPAILQCTEISVTMTASFVKLNTVFSHSQVSAIGFWKILRLSFHRQTLAKKFTGWLRIIYPCFKAVVILEIYAQWGTFGLHWQCTFCTNVPHYKPFWPPYSSFSGRPWIPGTTYPSRIIRAWTLEIIWCFDIISKDAMMVIWERHYQ